MAELKYIRKRDGRIVPYSRQKIAEAIFKAAKAIGGHDKKIAIKLAEEVEKTLLKNFPQNNPEVEEIQDIVEKILIESGHAKTAKTFILYRAKRSEERAEKDKEKDCETIKKLRKLNVPLSKQAIEVLNNTDKFDELGRTIFLDRYSLKTKREEIGEGDLLIVITKEDSKFPKKDLGIVKKLMNKEYLLMHMITGIYADPKSHYEFKQHQRMCDKPIESANEAYRRVAKAAATIEKTPEEREQWYKEFWEELKKNHIQPAGRIMTGANVDKLGTYTSRLTLYNCYVIPSPKDSRESIVKETLYQMTEIMSRGGGVGINLSTLRPRYAYVKGVHGKSSGAVSWGGLYSYSTGLIEQGGSRRGALMLMLGDWHPDIEEFIDSKTKSGTIENANISVTISDKFMEAVKKDKEWNLIFPDYENPVYKETYDAEWDGDIQVWIEKGHPVKIYKTVKARDLWNKIISSAWASAEPGIVFIERYNKLSNSYYFNRIICTNPCGEQGLPKWGVCNLGHLYLASFLKKIGKDNIGAIYDIDWNSLKKSTRTLVRFLDNIIDLTPYHFPENEQNQKTERRIGAGTLGLGELLIKLRIKYGSSESIKLIEKIYKTIAVEAYISSSDLAEEKGSFPKFDEKLFLESGFVKEMPKEVRESIRKKGIRNVTLTTQAPTGTVGTMLGTSTGIEPYYAFEFYRQSRLGFHKVLIPLAREYKDENGKLPEFFVGAMDLTPLEHIKVQAAVQKWTDSSISKTANAPANFTVEQTAELYEKAYDLGCKGVTIYRDSSRDQQVLSTNADTEKTNEEAARKKIGKNNENSKSYMEINEETVIEKNNNHEKHPESYNTIKTEFEEIVNDNLKDSNSKNEVYGSNPGEMCPVCKKGIMIKMGGCTECSAGCGFTGSCDMR